MPQARGFIGAGDVLLNPYDENGVQTGWVSAGDASKFAIKPNSDIKELESKGRDTYGQVVATVALQKPADFSITLREANRTNLTLAFMGQQASLSQGAGTVTEQAVTARLGKWVELGHQNLAASGLVVTNDSGTTTYVLGTDFEVNYRLGLLHTLPGGDIAEDQDLKVSYAYAAMSGSLVRGAVRPQLRCSVMLDGKNVADDRPVICRVFEAVLTPSGEFDFLADDWNEVELQGRLVTPSGRSEPFVVEFRD